MKRILSKTAIIAVALAASVRAQTALDQEEAFGWASQNGAPRAAKADP